METAFGTSVLVFANLLYVVCYVIRDVLWLRILAVAAMLTMILYYVWGMRTEDGSAIIQWGCLVWQFVFIGINVYWIVRIFQERRPPDMTPDQKRLYEMVFKDACTPNNMLKLLAQADWQEAEVGDRLIRCNTDLNELLLIHQGIANVEVNGEHVAELRPGDLVGEMSFLTRNKTVADVTSKSPLKYLSWKREALRPLFDSNLELKSAIYQIIGRDLVEKLATSTTKVPELTESSIARLDD